MNNNLIVKDSFKNIFKYVVACLAGGLAPLSLSPLNLWPLSLISIFIALLLLQNSSNKESAILGWSYGLGFFGVGASWIFVSINVYGNASTFFAGFLTLCFVALLSFLFSLQFWCYQLFNKKKSILLSFSAIWVLFEWLRSWLFTGFPWLYLGYGHINTPLAGLAPLFGVMSISFVIVFIASFLFSLPQHFQKSWHNPSHFLNKKMVYSVYFLLTTLGISFLLTKISWVTELTEKNIEVGLVQANIDQGNKFSSELLQNNLDTYQQLSQSLWDTDIIFWPETAIPLFHHQSSELLDFYTDKALLNNSTLVTGIFSQIDSRVHNSIISIGNGSGIYHKQKMVPFGEYLPFASVMEPLLTIFNLPMSNVQPGPAQQGLLTAANLTLAPFICYEVVYPDFVRKQAIDVDFLVTISNDSWFGNSFGPLQHLQMAAMRALENGRYMVRATSNGVSAIINEKGQIVASSQQFQTQILRAEVKVFAGRTPFSYWGSMPILLFCLFILLLPFIPDRVKNTILAKIRPSTTKTE